MILKTKSAFIIPKGTIVSKELMDWIKQNCKKAPECDLPFGWNEMFGGKNV